METIAGRFVVDPSWPGHVGDMSRVIKAVDVQNGMKPVAVKLFDGAAFQQPTVSEAFARECDSLERLSSHENIVTLIDLGRDDESGCRYIALEWCEATLLEQVRREPAPSWNDFYSRYGRDVLQALRFAYTQDVLHRDVKPQNVLIGPNGRACVTDFGISKFRRYYKPGVTLAHFKSTPYAPPEDAFESRETRDVFSFVVLCLECLGTISYSADDSVVGARPRVERATDLPPRPPGFVVWLGGNPDDGARPFRVSLVGGGAAVWRSGNPSRGSDSATISSVFGCVHALCCLNALRSKIFIFPSKALSQRRDREHPIMPVGACVDRYRRPPHISARLRHWPF